MKGRCWTEEEDRLLAETVLRSVREGGNQLDAFQEVAEKINRTPGACGFRWNAVVRKREAETFRKAKKERVENQLKRKRKPSITINDVIRQLKEFEAEYLSTRERLSELEKRLAEKEKKLQAAEAEHSRLTEEWNAFESFQNEIKDRYTSLLRLFQTARQLETTGRREILGEETEYKEIGAGVESKTEAES
ncbi:DNA-binding protein [Kroppenstedtia guangzhouensis]|uniref:DNA-binding protein n=1 Tax=Kroppenstedtia guangzhouensis TaxID=1274356 RepID=A0ABQ1H2A5_9BACL|nr:Myb-like DNA-binding domain-containing protein [Kroppenstedtia guangzhouensis]GGA55156.1 DNA-binding protein [Kroppenstedtia guangzhouensis]